MNWLRDLRIKAKLSQQEVANGADIKQPSYCNIESGERTPSVNTAKKIAEVLGFDWTDFYNKE